jgi:hypothetical protein
MSEFSRPPSRTRLVDGRFCRTNKRPSLAPSDPRNMLKRLSRRCHAAAANECTKV